MDDDFISVQLLRVSHIFILSDMLFKLILLLAVIKAQLLTPSHVALIRTPAHACMKTHNSLLTGNFFT